MSAPLAADIAVRIAAEMVVQIVNALRPRDTGPLRREQMVVTIGRAAGVDMPEVREADAADREWLERDAQFMRLPASPAPLPQSAEEGA